MKFKNRSGHDNSAEDAQPNVIYNKTVLANGLVIISEKIPTVQSYSLGVCINAGSRDETMDKPGVAHFMEHAAFRSTKNRSSKQIATQFESLGAYTNAFTTKEQTCFYVRALKDHFANTLSLLSDIVLNPAFLKTELDKERTIIHEEVKSYEDDPEELAFDIGDRILFPSHTLGNPIIGTLKSLDKIQVADLQNFHSEFYTPDNMILAVAGNIAHDYIVDCVAPIFEQLKPSQASNTRVNPDYSVPIHESIEKHIQQTHLLYGIRTQGVSHDERYPLAVLNMLFGDGMSCRLYQSMREKHGLAYSVYSSLQTYSDCGAFYIYAATDKLNAEKAEKLLFDEAKKVVDSKITTAEWRRAKEQLKSSSIMELESMSARMQSLCKNELNSGSYMSVEETISKIESVSIEQVTELANKYLDPAMWSKAMLSPKSKKNAH